MAGFLASDWEISILASTAMTSEAAGVFNTSCLALGCPSSSICLYRLCDVCQHRGPPRGPHVLRPALCLRLKAESDTIGCIPMCFLSGSRASPSCWVGFYCELGTGPWLVSRDRTFGVSARRFA